MRADTRKSGARVELYRPRPNEGGRSAPCTSSRIVPVETRREGASPSEHIGCPDCTPAMTVITLGTSTTRTDSAPVSPPPPPPVCSSRSSTTNISRSATVLDGVTLAVGVNVTEGVLVEVEDAVSLGVWLGVMLAVTLDVVEGETEEVVEGVMVVDAVSLAVCDGV